MKEEKIDDHHFHASLEDRQTEAILISKCPAKYCIDLMKWQMNLGNS